MFYLKYIVLIIVIIGSYIDWKKYKDKDFLWYFYLGICGLLLALWGNFANQIFRFSDEFAFLNNAVVIFLATILVLLFLIIGFLQIRKKRCRL